MKNLSERYKQAKAELHRVGVSRATGDAEIVAMIPILYTLGMPQDNEQWFKVAVENNLTGRDLVKFATENFEKLLDLWWEMG